MLVSWWTGSTACCKLLPFLLNLFRLSPTKCITQSIMQRAVDAICELVDKKGGKLDGARVLPELSAISPVLRKAVEHSGGLKQFCLKSDTLEFVSEAAGNGCVRRKQVQKHGKDVVHALLNLIDTDGGKLGASQAVPRLAKLSPAFKTIVENAGGLKKFCAAHREVQFTTQFGSDGCIQKRAQHVSAQDVVNFLIELVEKAGGQLGASQVVPELGKAKTSFKGIIEAAGGLKKFCTAHRELEFITQFGGDGIIQKRAQEVSAQDVVDTLLDLVDNAGGKLCGNKVLPELNKVKPSLKAVVDEAGGLKKFCETHRELEFSTDSGGSGAVRKRAADVTPQNVVNDLLEMLDIAGGKLGGSRAASELLKKRPEFKVVFDAVGGLKRFCELHHELEFISDSASDGHVKRRLLETSQRGLVRTPGQPIEKKSCKLSGNVESRTRHGSEASAATTKTIMVSQIRWSQDCIKATFRNGGLLIDLLQELLQNPSRVHCLAIFDVVEHDGRIYAISGNRRLWVLKEYAAIKDPSLQIRTRLRVVTGCNKWARLFKMRFSTKNSGMHVDIVLKHHLQKLERFSTMALALGAMLQKQGQTHQTARAREDSTDSSASSTASVSSTTASSSNQSVMASGGISGKCQQASRLRSHVAQAHRGPEASQKLTQCGNANKRASRSRASGIGGM